MSEFTFRWGRVLILVIFLMALIAPWIKAGFSGLIVVYWGFSLSLGIFAPDWWNTAFPLVITLVALLCLLVYLWLSLQVIRFGDIRSRYRVRLTFLFSASSGVLFFGLWISSQATGHGGPFEPTWGYWLVAIALLSSILLEIMDRAKSLDSNPKSI